MKVIGPFAAAVVLLFPLLSFAHGGGKHIMGTVKAVEDRTLTIETKDKKEVKVDADDQTKFEKSGAAATIKDLGVGERVVVHTAKPEKSGATKAVMVKFGAPPAAHPAGHEHHAGGPSEPKKAP
jgi:hypothetical protein